LSLVTFEVLSNISLLLF